jgi:hypothetical protein
MAFQAGLAVYFIVETTRDYSMIDVKLKNNRDEYRVEFSRLGLAPGEQADYTVSLKGFRDEECDVFLSFVDMDENLTLKDFVYAKVSINGETVCDEPLRELFEKDRVELSYKFKNGEDYKILISYYMPLSVGDEAQNAEATFDLVITITNSEDFYG